MITHMYLYTYRYTSFHSTKKGWELATKGSQLMSQPTKKKKRNHNTLMPTELWHPTASCITKYHEYIDILTAKTMQFDKYTHSKRGT